MSPTYSSWKNMRARCADLKNLKYGGRGIRVCERWASFKAFLSDMGERPSLEHSIERKDNNGNYELTNCIWATEANQQRNRRNNRMLTFGGRTMCVTDWAKELGMDPRRLFNRIARGNSLDLVLSPKRNRWSSRKAG